MSEILLFIRIIFVDVIDFVLLLLLKVCILDLDLLDFKSCLNKIVLRWRDILFLVLNCFILLRYNLFQFIYVGIKHFHFLFKTIVLIANRYVLFLFLFLISFKLFFYRSKFFFVFFTYLLNHVLKFLNFIILILHFNLKTIIHFEYLSFFFY